MTTCIRTAVHLRAANCLGLCAAAGYTGGVVWRKRDEARPPSYQDRCAGCGLVAQVVPIAAPTAERRPANEQTESSDWMDP